MLMSYYYGNNYFSFCLYLSFHLVAPLYFCYCHILVHVPPVYHCAISSVTVMRLELLRMALHY